MNLMLAIFCSDPGPEPGVSSRDTLQVHPCKLVSAIHGLERSRLDTPGPAPRHISLLRDNHV